jgi:lipooligosaccharide transport system permease protein
VVQLSPLYHGVAVVRGLNLGQPDWTMLAHLAVLAALALVGLGITSRRITGLLLH